MRYQPFVAAAAAVLLVAVGAAPAFAVTSIWDDGGPIPDDFWGTAANWAGDAHEHSLVD